MNYAICKTRELLSPPWCMQCWHVNDGGFKSYRHLNLKNMKSTVEMKGYPGLIWLTPTVRTVWNVSIFFAGLTLSPNKSLTRLRCQSAKMQVWLCRRVHSIQKNSDDNIGGWGKTEKHAGRTHGVQSPGQHTQWRETRISLGSPPAKWRQCLSLHKYTSLSKVPLAIVTGRPASSQVSIMSCRTRGFTSPLCGFVQFNGRPGSQKIVVG